MNWLIKSRSTLFSPYIIFYMHVSKILQTKIKIRNGETPLIALQPLLFRGCVLLLRISKKLRAYYMYFKNSAGSNCLTNVPTLYNETEYQSSLATLPGQRFTLNDMCALVHGQGSVYCGVSACTFTQHCLMNKTVFFTDFVLGNVLIHELASTSQVLWPHDQEEFRCLIFFLSNTLNCLIQDRKTS